MTEQQKQVVYSGILGDGYFRGSAGINYNCLHKEYMEYKYSIMEEYCKSGIKHNQNLGYKKGSDIFSFNVCTNDFCKELSKKDYIKEAIENLDEFGVTLLFYDDGSRHKKQNFYNLNTHALEDKYQNMLLEKLKEFGIYMTETTETKKDGRHFSYLFVDKWQGGMIVSRFLRSVPLDCYSYKLCPKDLEDMYFKVKDTEEFKSKKNNYSKTCYIKKLLKNTTSS